MSVKSKLVSAASRNAVLRRVFRKFGIDLKKAAQSNMELSVFSYSQRNITLDNDYLNISCYVNGGIGDIIINIGTLINIKNKFECNINLYIYTDRYSEVCQIFEMFENINIINSYFYENDMRSYDVSFQMAHYLVLKYVNMNSVEGKCQEFLYFLRMIQVKNKKDKFYIEGCPYTDGILAQRELIKGRNRWTEFNIGDFINKSEVPLHLDMFDMDFIEKMSLKYITFNWGSDAYFNTIQPKVWPKENFEALISLLHTKYPLLKIVQIGSSNVNRLAGVDYTVLGESFSRVKTILKHSLLHIDSEGGLVHLSRQLKTKCAVLFGPTPQKYFEYAENININANACFPCMWVDKDWQSHCVKGDAIPHCMKSITPEIVMNAISYYLDSIKDLKFTIVNSCLYSHNGIENGKSAIMDICHSAHTEYLDHTHHIYGDGDTYIHASKQWEYPYVIEMMRKLDICSGKVCNVGAGRGMLDGYLAGKGYDVTVCDMDYKWDSTKKDATFHYIQYAKHKGFKAEIGSIFNLPYENETFDVVLCISVIEHVLHKKYALDELLRVVKKDGYVILTFDLKYKSSDNFGRSEVATPQILTDLLGVQFSKEDMDVSIHDIAVDRVLGIPEGMTVGGVVLKRID